jgi:molybdate transport system permease protein
VALPLAKPGMVTAAILSFAHTVGEFGVVLMIGGSIPGQTQTASIYIYNLSQSLQFDQAAQAAGILLAISFGLVYLVRVVDDRP